MLKYQYKIFENTSLNKDGGKAVFVNTLLIPFKDKEHKVMEKHILANAFIMFLFLPGATHLEKARKTWKQCIIYCST